MALMVTPVPPRSSRRRAAHRRGAGAVAGCACERPPGWRSGRPQLAWFSPCRPWYTMHRTPVIPSAAVPASRLPARSCDVPDVEALRVRDGPGLGVLQPGVAADPERPAVAVQVEGAPGPADRVLAAD